ncbi:MAG: hypothetical protein OXT65_03315 [Alphaproteobacteria bacterium]|nr:hypothetical protein [Alphaproteobacteria bacterium]
MADNPDNAFEKGCQLLREIERQNTDACLRLIKDGADVNITDHAGFTPLMLAARQGINSLVTALLDQGANVNERGGHGHWAPLVLATRNNNPVTTTTLLERGANVNTADGDGFTALMDMAVHNQIGVVSLMIEKGVNLDAKSKSGKTAEDIAKGNGHKELETMLAGERIRRTVAAFQKAADAGTPKARPIPQRKRPYIPK